MKNLLVKEVPCTPVPWWENFNAACYTRERSWFTSEILVVETFSSIHVVLLRPLDVLFFTALRHPTRRNVQ